jgi:hypothetical protein
VPLLGEIQVMSCVTYGLVGYGDVSVTHSRP